MASSARTTVVLRAHLFLVIFGAGIAQMCHQSGRVEICWKGRKNDPRPSNVLAMRYMRQVRQEHEIVSLPYVLSPSFSLFSPRSWYPFWNLWASSLLVLEYVPTYLSLSLSRLERRVRGSLTLFIHIIRGSREIEKSGGRSCARACVSHIGS